MKSLITLLPPYHVEPQGMGMVRGKGQEWPTSIERYSISMQNSALYSGKLLQSDTEVIAFFFSRSARTAGTKIALRFPRLFVCLSVCASALITCAIYYVIRYYATAVYSSFWRFAGQATANEGR